MCLHVLEEFWVSPESQQEWTFCNDHIYGIATDWYRLLGIKLISWRNRSANIGTSQKQQQSTTVLLGSVNWDPICWDGKTTSDWNHQPMDPMDLWNLGQFHFGLPKKWTQQPAFLDGSTGNFGLCKINTWRMRNKTPAWIQLHRDPWWVVDCTRQGHAVHENKEHQSHADDTRILDAKRGVRSVIAIKFDIKISFNLCRHNIAIGNGHLVRWFTY